MADVKTDSISSTEFGKLFFEFKPRFIALAYRYVRDRETAEDLVSDSFMTFWEMHENLPADTNVPAYILTSVKNRCLNYLNAQIRHRRAVADLKEIFHLIYFHLPKPSSLKLKKCCCMMKTAQKSSLNIHLVSNYIVSLLICQRTIC